MLIAQQKRKENIAEYVIYMWQIEDIIRSFNLSISLVEEHVISKYQVSEKVKLEIKKWYVDIIQSMRSEGVVNEGHLSETTKIIGELNFLHQNILKNPSEKEYQGEFEKVSTYINELREKALRKNKSDIEICFDGLYSFLLLKLKNKEIHQETLTAFKEISKFIAKLVVRYNKAFTTS